LSNDLQEERKSLLSKKSSLETNIRSYNAIIAQAKKKIEEHSVALLKNQAGLKAKTAWCDAASRRYLGNSKERKRELALLVKLQKHFAKKLGGMKTYLEGRVNKFWKNTKNL